MDELSQVNNYIGKLNVLQCQTCPSMKELVSVKYRNLLSWSIALVIFVYLGKMVCDHWEQVKDTAFTLDPASFITGTILTILSYFIQFWGWYRITLKLDIALSPTETMENWFYSLLGKYIPGKVWVLLGRFYVYESRGKSKQGISLALFFETVTALMAAGLLFCVSLVFFNGRNFLFPGGRLWWSIPIFMLALVAIHPRVLQKFLDRGLPVFGKIPVILTVPYAEILRILLIYVLSWFVGGVGFYFFANSIVAISSRFVLFLGGALAFSCIAGLLAFFAPGGLGVREGALVYLLSYVIPGPVAVIISVLGRLWTTLIEIGLIGVVYMISRLRKGLAGC